MSARTLSLAFLALPLLSQAPPQEASLPEVKVRGRAAKEDPKAPVVGYVATRSATATKLDLPLAETPQAISVITADQIRDQGARTLQEVLRYAPGVNADVYGLDNRGDWFLLRGGSQGSTLLDGLRRPLSGWYGIVRDEPYAFERVEVLRGPASVMAGQNGPGGVVNLVSKRPQAQAQNEVEVQGGTFGHRQVAADVTGPADAKGEWLYRVVALGRDSRTQVDHADEERQLVAPSLTWRPGTAGSVTVFAEYQRDRSKNTEGFFPLVGTVTPGPHGFIPTNTFISEPDWDTYGGTRIRGGFEAEYRLGAAWTLRAGARHDEVNGKLRSMYANYWEGFLPDGRSLDRTWYATDNHSSVTNAQVLVEGRLAWGNIRHTVMAGVDGLWMRDSQAYLSGAATPLDVYAPAYGAFPRPVLAFGPATVTRTRETGLVAQDQMKIDGRFVVMAGLRLDRSRGGVEGAPDKADSASTRNLGLLYLAEGGWSPYASYAESFEPVAGADVHGVAFRPKRGRQVEAGLKWAPAGPFTASAAAYRLVETNRLTTDPSDPGNQVQKGEVTVRGAELEANANLPAWDLVAKYTLALAEFTASSDPADPSLGKRVPNVPEHAASLWAVRKFRGGLQGFRAGLGVRYVGVTWDGTDTQKTPANTLWDGLASYERGPWRFALNATNLFDRTYVVALLNRGDAWFGTRRKVVLSAGYRW
ncbi:TonB-dependent siderophore receptor [Mesoterricola silvestris]|uniref:Ferrisiderophore receptor n=1 Tax=Mesoterricola silvestris TaxID=2927979 RepID=A0AA48GQR8_9BACT|nr:TonB-dependent siderophore receptor [Mesoterricola silvestris]BDU72287.1 ferrisiderophore receptor [Mesoterricola silvestris]